MPMNSYIASDLEIDGASLTHSGWFPSAVSTYVGDLASLPISSLLSSPFMKCPIFTPTPKADVISSAEGTTVNPPARTAASMFDDPSRLASGHLGSTNPLLSVLDNIDSLPLSALS